MDNIISSFKGAGASATELPSSPSQKFTWHTMSLPARAFRIVLQYSYVEIQAWKLPPQG